MEKVLAMRFLQCGEDTVPNQLFVENIATSVEKNITHLIPQYLSNACSSFCVVVLKYIKGS